MPFEYIESDDDLASDESADEGIFLRRLDGQLNTLRDARVKRFQERQKRARDLHAERRQRVRVEQEQMRERQRREQEGMDEDMRREAERRQEEAELQRRQEEFNRLREFRMRQIRMQEEERQREAAAEAAEVQRKTVEFNRLREFRMNEIRMQIQERQREIRMQEEERQREIRMQEEEIQRIRMQLEERIRGQEEERRRAAEARLIEERVEAHPDVAGPLIPNLFREAPTHERPGDNFQRANENLEHLEEINPVVTEQNHEEHQQGTADDALATREGDNVPGIDRPMNIRLEEEPVQPPTHGDNIEREERQVERIEERQALRAPVPVEVEDEDDSELSWVDRILAVQDRLEEREQQEAIQRPVAGGADERSDDDDVIWENGPIRQQQDPTMNADELRLAQQQNNPNRPVVAMVEGRNGAIQGFPELDSAWIEQYLTPQITRPPPHPVAPYVPPQPVQQQQEQNRQQQQEEAQQPSISRLDQVRAIFPDVCPMWIAARNNMTIEELINVIIENPRAVTRIAKPKKRHMIENDDTESPSKRKDTRELNVNGQIKIYSTPNSGSVFANNHFADIHRKRDNYIFALRSSLSFVRVNWVTYPKDKLALSTIYDKDATKFLTNYFRKVGVLMIKKLRKVFMPDDLLRILELIELDQSQLVADLIGEEEKKKDKAALTAVANNLALGLDPGPLPSSWEGITNLRVVDVKHVPTLNEKFYAEWEKFFSLKQKHWEGLRLPTQGYHGKSILLAYGPIGGADSKKLTNAPAISGWPSIGGGTATNSAPKTIASPPMANILVSCIVCFGDVDVSRTVSCRPIEKEEGYANVNEEGVEHEICLECMIGHSKALCEDGMMARGGAGLPCADHECKRAILWAHVHPHLDKETRERLEKRIDNEVVLALNNVEYCKYCSFAAQMDASVEENKVFTCQQCDAEFCRICKRDFDEEHFGKKCDELDREDVESKSRRIKEEMMSEVVIRKCPRCNLTFQKDAGCNKMTCRCGTTQCYVCRKSNIDYTHFCQHTHLTPGVCPQNCGVTCLLHEDVAKKEKKELDRIEKGLPEDADIATPPPPPTRILHNNDPHPLFPAHIWNPAPVNPVLNRMHHGPYNEGIGGIPHYHPDRNHVPFQHHQAVFRPPIFGQQQQPQPHNYQQDPWYL